MNDTKGKVHILNSTTYEVDDMLVQMEASPPSEFDPEGMKWHEVLGKFVPKEDAEKEMWVEQEAVFGTGYEKEWQ